MNRKYFVLCEDDCKFEGMTKEQTIAAIAEATGNVPQSIDEAFISQIVNQNGGSLKLWRGTRAEYNALPEKDEAGTIYHITDDKTAQEAWNKAAEVLAKFEEYDSDEDGIVDNAAKLGGKTPDYYATSEAVEKAQGTANNKRAYTGYANGQTTSINDLKEDRNWRIYIQQNSNDHEYLGWYGFAQVETFRVDNSENRLYQRITSYYTGLTQVRYVDSDVFTYDVPLRTVSPVGDSQKYINTTATLTADKAQIINSATLPAGVYLIIGMVNFAANSTGRRACWTSDTANNTNWVSNRVTQVQAVTSGDATSINTITIEKFTEEKVINLVAVSSVAVSATGVLRIIRIG